MKVLTWNVWFGEIAPDRRLNAVITAIETHRPDVVALHEMQPHTLKQAMDALDGYFFSDERGGTVAPYGTILACLRKPHAWHLRALPSRMGRKLVAADLEYEGKTLRVCGAHLESLDNRELRCKQIDFITDYLKDTDSSILMGDMNFDAGAPEDELLNADYVDLWPALRSAEPGYTRDTEANLMAKLASDKVKQRRIDRIFLSRHGDWMPSNIELLGTQPINKVDPTLFASDHFGLVADISPKSSA